MKQVLGLRPRTILVISYGGIGDILLTTPLLRSLKNAFPAARVDVYVQSGREGVLEGNPDVASVLTTRRRHGARSYLDFVRDCAGRYDLAVSVRASDRQTLFARVAGRKAIGLVPERGSGNRWMRALLSGWARRDGGHCVDEILSLADVLGLERARRCTIPHDAASEARLDALLPFAWRQTAFALVHVHPRNVYKRWIVDAWKLVIEQMAERLRVVVIGSADSQELSYVEALRLRLAPGAADVLAGVTSLADAARLLRSTRVYVGLDTALTHLASVTRTPTVALHGPPLGRRYFPYHDDLLGEGVRIVEPGLEASGTVRLLRGACRCATTPTRCAREPSRMSDCMRSITPERVIAQVDEILAGRQSTSGDRSRDRDRYRDRDRDRERSG